MGETEMVSDQDREFRKAFIVVLLVVLVGVCLMLLIMAAIEAFRRWGALWTIVPLVGVMVFLFWGLTVYCHRPREVATRFWNFVYSLSAVTFNETSGEVAEPKHYFKEVEARLENMEETYGKARLGLLRSKAPGYQGRLEKARDKAELLRVTPEEYYRIRGRPRLYCLRASIYEGLAGDRPAAVWDWTGHAQKERRHIWVVAVTRDRVVEWKGAKSQGEGEDNRLHPNIKEVSLAGVDVEANWVAPEGWFRTALVDSRTRQVLHSWATPDWNGYAPALRLAVANLRRKAQAASGGLIWRLVDLVLPKPLIKGPPGS